jgi:hypothetical protein
VTAEPEIALDRVTAGPTYHAALTGRRIPFYPVVTERDLESTADAIARD